jgi:flagellar basal-body rod protein FlgF
MNYGMYMSATGVMANSYRQDVIANNLANSETVGFKRDETRFQQRLTAAQEMGRPDKTDPMEDNVGGGFFISPSQTDLTQGDLETTGNNLDAAIVGKGFFGVDNHGKTQLTRVGQFMLDKDGMLITANGDHQQVLDSDGQPIKLPGLLESKLKIGKDGQITHDGKAVARLGVFSAPDISQLSKQGNSLFDYPTAKLQPSSDADYQLRNEVVERANVDPANELTQLMECQRELEANANMIRYQDTELGRCVNEVGKIS